MLSYSKIRRYLRAYPNGYPRFLYKYVSSDISENKLVDYLLDSSFWLSSPLAFNDPFDTSALVVNDGTVIQKRNRWIKIVKKSAPILTKKQRDLVVSRLMAGASNTPDNIRKVFQQNIESLGVFCMSETPKNLLMWRHYANHHKGIDLQFEIAKDPQTMLFALRADYSNEYPTLNFAQDLIGQLSKIMLRKSDDWKYEKEWRIVIITGASTYLKFKPEALTGIIFGCRADEKIKLSVENLLSKRLNKGISAPKLYVAERDPSKYKIIIKSMM